MNSKTLKIIYLNNKTDAISFPKEFLKFFEIIDIKTDQQYIVSEETIGIILDINRLDENVCDVLMSNKSLTSNIGICVITEDYQLASLQQISISFQTVLFTQEQFKNSPASIWKSITEFFISFSKIRYYNQVIKHTNNRSETIETLRVIAHQWRQPINLISMESINLMVKASLDTKIISKEIIKSSNIISEQTQRMSNVLKSILNLGKVQRTKELFSINKLLESIEELYTEQFYKEDVSLVIEYLKEDNQIYGFFTDLHEVIVNLISNARDAYIQNMGDKSETILLNVNVNLDEYLFTVKDRAGGVPEPIREKIFEPNFSTKTGEEGFGIGLHIAQLIIKQEFKGKISLRSNPEGSEFIVSIPRNDLCNIKFIH